VTYHNQSASFGRRGADTVAEAPRARRVDVEEIAVNAALLLTYIGHNSHEYDGVVGALASRQDNFRGTAWSWCWAALFVPTLWLVYRKLWVVAACVFFLEMIIGYIFPWSSLAIIPFRVALAAMAKGLYVNFAAGRIKRLLVDQTSAAEAIATIRAAGGVSAAAVWAVIAFNVVVVVLIVMAAIAAKHHGL
jgi:hypothetical protein